MQCSDELTQGFKVDPPKDQTALREDPFKIFLTVGVRPQRLV